MMILTKDFAKMNINRKLQTTLDNVRSRCRNQKNDHYARYGGRGIKCHWQSIKDFRHDMLQPLLDAIKKYPNFRLSIDRIDNDGDYCKENCQWIPISHNSRKATKGVPKSAAHRLAMSKERKNKPQTEARKKMLDAAREKRKKKVVMLLNGNEICCFKSIVDAAIFINAPPQNVNEVIIKRGYRKTVRGYGFEYISK